MCLFGDTTWIYHHLPGGSSCSGSARFFKCSNANLSARFLFDVQSTVLLRKRYQRDRLIATPHSCQTSSLVDRPSWNFSVLIEVNKSQQWRLALFSPLQWRWKRVQRSGSKRKRPGHKIWNEKVLKVFSPDFSIRSKNWEKNEYKTLQSELHMQRWISRF